MDKVLTQIEDYYDAVPRAAADVEEHGPFTIFVSRITWPFYARPSQSHVGPAATTADVLALRERLRALRVPESIEWVDEVTPGLVEPVLEAGLTVERLPLQVLDSLTERPAPAGTRVRLVPPDDPDLARINQTVHLGFGSAGTAVGDVGPAERDAAALTADAAGVEQLRDRIRRGLTVMAVASDDEGPLAAGSHQPVGPVSEVVGVATLPTARRRGLGATVTAALVADAHAKGIETIFLSAGSDDVARVYERVGFRRVATACIAELPTTDVSNTEASSH